MLYENDLDLETIISISEEQIQFQNGEVTLAGTLVTPNSRGPHPAVVFIHGSGRQSRDYYRTFADHFAKHGIAGLVYDKRGVGESTGEFRNDTVSSFSDLANDALTGLAFLQGRQDIDMSKIGLSGISQGGWLGPLAASRSETVAFVICVSGPGVDAHSQMNFAIPNLLRADGCTEREIRKALEDRARWYERIHKIAMTGDGWDQLEALLNGVRGKKWAQFVVDETWFDVADLRSSLTSAVMEEDKDYMSHNPKAVLEKVTCSVLAVFGDSDIIVPVKDSVSVFEEALIKAGNKDYTIKMFSGANHRIMVGDEYAEGYLETMTNWLLERLDVD